MLIRAWVGFDSYPQNFESPRDFVLLVNTKLAYGSVINETKKIGRLWNRKHPNEWFVKTVKQEFGKEILIDLGTGFIQQSMTIQTASSFAGGIFIGPFNSEEDILKWYECPSDWEPVEESREMDSVDYFCALCFLGVFCLGFYFVPPLVKVVLSQVFPANSESLIKYKPTK